MPRPRTSHHAVQERLEALQTVLESGGEIAKLDSLITGIDSLNAKLAGTNVLGYTGSPVSLKVAEGKFYISGAAVTLPGGLGATARACFQLENPVGNNKVFYVVRGSIYSDVGQQITYYENATVTGPTTSSALNINRASAKTSSAVLRSGQGFTGGTKFPNESRVANVDVLQLEFPPLVLPPGKSLLIAGTSSSAQTLTANVYWYEE